MKIKTRSKKAFTISEVVITLIVIGIISAITVPIMNNSITDKKWNAARQKAQATIGEAFKLITVNGEITTKKSDGTDMTTADFVNTVIPKYLKIEKTCTPADYTKCGFPSTVKTPKGVTVGLTPNNYKWTEFSEAKVSKKRTGGYSSWSQSNSGVYTSVFPNTIYDTSYYFRTLDGFSVAFLYNPYCASDRKEFYTYTEVHSNERYYVQQSLDTVCLMGIYDMNGKQGPNKVGMDIGFVGSFYNGFETKTTAVLPHSEEKAGNASGLTGSTTWDKLNNYCNNLGQNNDWIMPNLNEVALMYVNNKLITNNKIESKIIVTSTPIIGNRNYVTAVVFNSGDGGQRTWGSLSNGHRVRCIRNNALK